METNSTNNTKKIPGRGTIQSNNSYYYIINELLDMGELKSFTASKFTLEDGQRIFDNKKYLIKFISKDWIRNNIFKKIKMVKLTEENFFDNILKNSNFVKDKIKSDNIQKLYDCIIDNRGIFIVLEYCENSLSDYLRVIKDGIKNFSTYPYEVKIRNIITQILSITNHIHTERNLFFGALLNFEEIMIHEVDEGSYQDEEKKAAEVMIKLPNPFMSDILTIFLITESKANNCFPSFLAPEIMRDFDISTNKKYSYDYSNLVNKISQNTDMWSLGYMIYTLVFDEQPFIFDSYTSAMNSLNEKFRYEIYPHKISKSVTAVIIKCLQLDAQNRMDSILLQGIIKSLEYERNSLEVLEAHLKKNIEAKEKEIDKGLCKFDILSDNGYDFSDL